MRRCSNQHPTRPTRIGALAAGLAAIALFLAVPSALAEARDIHPVLREFMPTGKYVFDPATEKPAAVYFSQRAAAYLVRGTPLGDPLLVRTGTSEVERVSNDMIVCRPDGGCDLAADAKPTPLGTWRLSGTEMLIQVPGLTGKLKPRPPLGGWIVGSELRLAQPEYDRDAKKYDLDAALVAELRKTKGEVRVFVYFGSWCSTCNMLMGRILRLDEALAAEGGPKLRFDYYAAPNVPRFYQDAEISSGRIDRLPTGLVYVDGTFVGRIVSTAWLRPEAALRNLLASRR
ncbi:MAG TPA: thioredoxin family protein [Planctomycetota bacterium]|nr:thioredoxin family protein [Planctomycetota bacterium]